MTRPRGTRRDSDAPAAFHPDQRWIGHFRGERLRQRVVRGRGHGDRDRAVDCGRGRGRGGVGIEKVHGVILVLKQFVEHLSFIAFRRRLGVRREPVKVDETVIPRRWGDMCLGHGPSMSGVVRERVLRRRDGDKGAKVRVWRVLRRLARTRGGAGEERFFRGRESRRSGGRGGREERRKPIHVRLAQRKRRLRGSRLRGHVDSERLAKRRALGQREVAGHAHVACNDTRHGRPRGEWGPLTIDRQLMRWMAVSPR